MKLFGKPLKLLIVDVDGVILDVIEYLERDLKVVASRHDLPYAPVDAYLKEVYAGIRHGHASFAEGCREFWPVLSAKESFRLAWQFQEERRKNPWPAINGSVEAIKWFRKHAIPLAICTTNDRKTLEHQLNAAGIEFSWFFAASTWESPYRKPDPRCLDPIFDAVEVPRGHAVYIGDWYPDVKAAKGADVPFIAVLSGGIPRHVFLKEGVPEDHIIPRFADLKALVTPR